MPRRDGTIPPDGLRALEALEVLSKKWAPIVLLTLRERGSAGFNELLEAVPDVSAKVLSETLESLQEVNLVDRRVTSEAPLRVEYERTEAGRELDTVFTAMATWVDEHIEGGPRTVLVADTDRRMTRMYADWLSSRYTVRRAHGGDELVTDVDETVDVALVDVGVLGPKARRFVSGFDTPTRTVLIVGDRPDFGILTLECDDVLRKPFVRETALKTVEEQLTRFGEPTLDRERESLLARRSLFESLYPVSQLESHDAYQSLVTRLESLAES